MQSNNRGNQEQGRRSGFQLDFANLALSGALIMILISGFTTFSGMAQIIQPVIAFSATFVIQIMLATTSWFLGQDLGRLLSKQRLSADESTPSVARVIVVSLFFMLAFIPSAFFSFTYYFNSLMSLSQGRLVASNLPRQLHTQVMPAVRDEVLINAPPREVEKISNADEIKKWRADIDKIILAADSSRQLVTARINKQAEQDREKTVAISDAQRERQRVEREIGEKRLAIKELEKQIVAFQPKLSELRAQQRDAETEAKKEELGIGETGKPTCGPVCNKYLQQAAEFKGQADRIENATAPLRTERDGVQKEVEALEKRIGELNAKLEGLGAGAPAGGAEPQPANAGTTVSLASLDDLKRTLAARREGFNSDPDPRSYDAVVQSCVPILRAVQEIQRDSVGTAACGSDAVGRLVAPRPALREARAAFERQCIRDMDRKLDEATELVRKGRELAEGLSSAQRAIEQCINAAGLAGVSPARLEEFQEQVRVFVENKSPARDNFARTLGAFSLGRSQASMALVMSVVQDIVILALSLFAELFRQGTRIMPTAHAEWIPKGDYSPRVEPPPLAASRAILRLARFDPKLRRTVFDATAESIGKLPEAVRENIDVRLQRFQQAGWASHLPSGEYSLSAETIAALEAEIAAAPPASGTPEPATSWRPPATERENAPADGPPPDDARTVVAGAAGAPATRAVNPRQRPGAAVPTAYRPARRAEQASNTPAAESRQAERQAAEDGARPANGRGNGSDANTSYIAELMRQND